MTEPDYRGSLEDMLRGFLKTCLALTGPEAGTAGADSRPILKALFETVLPFDHPKFPLVPGLAASRFEALFHRKEEWRDAVRRGLAAFNGVEAFAQASTRALAEERNALERYPSNTPEMVQKQLDQKLRQDEKLLAYFLKKQGIGAMPFAELGAEARKDYFWLWSQSGFAMKRRFHRASRAALMAAAYSAPEFRKRGP